ncbi:barstar family protein [Pseudomonas panipatensis]|uniref:barstar family protein n=1 Tax=Pseudomonas panipatensis TaxID=428992 RepID=UPI000B7D677E|nr:barstar family protein [Pseudomonas panipatensis]
MKITIDGHEVVTEQDFHRQLAEALGVQDFYGYNLDALWDLLSASVERPLVLVWNDHDCSRGNIPHEFDGIIEVLERVKQQDESFGWEDKFSYILD